MADRSRPLAFACINGHSLFISALLPEIDNETFSHATLPSAGRLPTESSSLPASRRASHEG